MSTHASTKIDQKEYLKKYLSGSKVKKKKKKDKKHKSKDAEANVKIIDDDIGAYGNGPEIDEELLLTGEDAPQIVGEYLDDGPNTSAVTKWRSIALKEEQLDENEKLEKDLWGRKADKINVKEEISGQKKSPDMSPPRKRQVKDGYHSPRRRRSRSMEHSNRQKSPKRKQRIRKYSSDESSSRKRRHSPCKSLRKSVSPDKSPVRKRQKSPVRRNDRSRSHDCSPPRHRRKDSSDQSQARQSDYDHSPSRKLLQSPSRHRRRKNSFDQPPTRCNLDQSPPRRRAQSPSNRHRRSSDQSPQRKRLPSNLSTHIKREKRTPDQSPPRKRNSSNSPIRIKREKRTPDHSPSMLYKTKRSPELRPSHSRWVKPIPTQSPSPPPTHKPRSTKTLDGKKAGLQDAQAMKAETEKHRRQEELLYAKMSNDISGRDAEVAVRSTGRRGQRARDAAAEDPELQRRKKAYEKNKRELYDRWGKGLKQIEDHRTRLAEQEYESSKPLARYSNDADLERHLREQERADDPMLEYMRKKKQEREKVAKVPTVPVYQGSFPENRFGIRPGYRWDGVDRSNGYEKKWFDVQNEKRAVQEEAYKYSVEDM